MDQTIERMKILDEINRISMRMQGLTTLEKIRKDQLITMQLDHLHAKLKRLRILNVKIHLKQILETEKTGQIVRQSSERSE